MTDQDLFNLLLQTATPKGDKSTAEAISAQVLLKLSTYSSDPEQFQQLGQRLAEMRELAPSAQWAVRAIREFVALLPADQAWTRIRSVFQEIELCLMQQDLELWFYTECLNGMGQQAAELNARERLKDELAKRNSTPEPKL